jgi:hypothetical protein
MSIDLEYAIRQDIRNNPVVREVDRVQKREFNRLLLWAAAIVVMLIGAVVPRFTVVATGYRAEELREELAAEQARDRQYLLELEVRTRPQHIRDRATRELGMVAPTESDTLILERVPPASRPGRAIVADARRE